MPAFVAMITVQALWGIGYPFTSGATAARVTGKADERNVAPVLLLGNQANLIGSIGGTLLDTGHVATTVVSI